MLSANADNIEEMTYARALSKEELDKRRMEFSQQAIEIARKQDELKSIKETFAADLKPMVTAYRETLQEIKSQQVMVTETVYHLADYDDGMMCTYNKQGELIMTRKLTAEEGQMRITNMKILKTAQNQ